MKMIKTTAELAKFCDVCSKFEYVTVDTEFLRERTYYSKLCLIQMAHPGEGVETAALIDTLSPDLDLAPLYALFQDTSVVKVFHAARQDLEIFYVDKQIIPEPFFDTQVAAMVCGFGEQVGYETLVRKIARQQLDKSSRFTDWSQRPLSDKQKTYAVGDVTHLREIYEFLAASLEKSGRTAWVKEELKELTSPSTYIAEPKNAWKRVKIKNGSGKMLAAVHAMAEFRETFAQTRDIPRNRVLKDEAILELAATRPKDHAQLSKSRLLLREARKGDIAQGLLDAIAFASALDPKDYPPKTEHKVKPVGAEALADLLRVLLKAKAEDAGVAQKIIATTSELDDIAAGDYSGRSFQGWRNEVFGEDATKLCQNKIALAAKGNSIQIIPINA